MFTVKSTIKFQYIHKEDIIQFKRYPKITLQRPTNYTLVCLVFLYLTTRYTHPTLTSTGSRLLRLLFRVNVNIISVPQNLKMHH